MSRSSDYTKEGRYSSGMDQLDRSVLNGGIPKGSTVAIVGDPAGPGEMLMHSLASTGRQTEYITTLRPTDYGLAEDIARVTNEYDAEDISEFVSFREKNKDLGSLVRKALNAVEDGNLIVDSFSEQAKSPEDQKQIARKIKTKTKINGGLSYIYFVAGDVNELTQTEREILQMVDGIIQIKTNIPSIDQVQYVLYVNKMRGVRIPNEGKELNVGKKLSIQSTGNI